MTFSEALKSGPQIGLGLMYPACGIVERIGPDWDWIWIDGQHGELGDSDILAAVRASNLIRRPAVVRIAGHEAGFIAKALDTAADAVIIPMVENAEQALRIVRATKFAPLGNRSFGGRRPIDLHGRGYAHPDHPQPMLICQIESLDGVKNVDSIAAVPGVDALFFGPDDMALRNGLPMDQPHPDRYFDKILRAIAQAAKKHDIFAGGVFSTPNKAGKAAELDYRLILGSLDVSLLAASSKAEAQSMRAALDHRNLTQQEQRE